MKLAVVAEALPNPGTVGSDVFCWGILMHLRDLGHDVLCCAIMAEPSPANRADHDAKVRQLDAAGIHLRTFFFPARRTPPSGAARIKELVDPDLSFVFPATQLTQSLVAALEAFSPDSVFVFDSGPVMALHGWKGAPKVAVPGDPAHLARAFQQKFALRPPLLSLKWLTQAISSTAFARKFTRELFSSLRSYDRVGYLGAQHARWAREHGIDCVYVKMCVADRVGTAWREKRRRFAGKDKIKILFLGHLGGTASRVGLDEFVDVTVPLLEKNLGQGTFELHVVGRGLPPDVAQRFKRPGVVLRGFVEDAMPEYLSADVFLSATPYPVGIRTRIVEAFSFGTAVVTHPDSACGLPELRDGENVLFGRNGVEWAEAVTRIAKDATLREKLSVNARRTYEESFIPSVSAGQIFGMMKDAIDRRASARRST